MTSLSHIQINEQKHLVRMKRVGKKKKRKKRERGREGKRKEERKEKREGEKEREEEKREMCLGKQRMGERVNFLPVFQLSYPSSVFHLVFWKIPLLSPSTPK